MQKMLETSFTKKHYMSHKILLETQPFLTDKANLLQEAEQFLRENAIKDSIQKSRRAAPLEGRG